MILEGAILITGTTNQAALADSVNIIDDHLERRCAVLSSSTLCDLRCVIILQILGKGQVAHVQDTDRTVVITARQHQASIGTARCKGHVQNTGLHSPANANSNIAISQFKAFVYDSTGFKLDNFLLAIQALILECLVCKHINNLLGAA